MELINLYDEEISKNSPLISQPETLECLLLVVLIHLIACGTKAQVAVETGVYNISNIVLHIEAYQFKPMIIIML